MRIIFVNCNTVYLYNYSVRQLHKYLDYKCLLKLVKNHSQIRKSHEKLGSPLKI